MISTTQFDGASNSSVRIHWLVWGLQCLLSACLGILVFCVLKDFPVAKQSLIVGLCLYLLVLWRFPWLWMCVIPCCLPVLDLTPWSGRVYFSEFDILVIGTVAVALLRRDNWLLGLRWSVGSWLLLFLIIFWQALTTVRGLLPLQPLDSNSFSSLYSNFNSLRLAKGFLLALLLLPLLGQSLARKEKTGNFLVYGMALSCISGIMALLWERTLFTGLMNFSKEYRATGFFSGTATGGAAVDAHLLMTLPFIFCLLLVWNKLALRTTVALIIALALYACAITFSRANYPALILAVLVFGAGWLYQTVRKAEHFSLGDVLRRYWLFPLIIFLAGVYFLSNPYIASRFSTTWDDMQTRLTHWSNAAELMEAHSSSKMVGLGKGSFPRNYYFSALDSQVMATAFHRADGHDRFIQFSKSDDSGSLYLRQRFNYSGDGTYRLKLELRRFEEKKARILVEFCERLILKEFSECSWLGFNLKGSPGEWEELNKTIRLRNIGREHWYGSRPVEVSVLNRGINQRVDVGLVELFDPSGEQILGNTDFDNGWDRWTLYSGNHLAWHIKNIFVDAYFEGGALGVSVFAFLLLILALKLFVSVKNGNKLAIAVAASLVAGFMVGQFDSLFDEPRITLLFFFLVWVIFSLGVIDLESPRNEGASVNDLRRSAQTVAGHVSDAWRSVVASRHRSRIFVSICVLMLLLIGVLGTYYLEHRHWMRLWNSVFSSRVEIPESQLLDTATLNTQPGEVLLDGKLQPNLRVAFRRAKDGSVISIDQGNYNEAVVLNANNVKVLASDGAVIFGKAEKGKGAIVVNGDNAYIEGIECHSIYVADKNGACIRLQGQNLHLNRVYFHHAETGVLGSPKGGDLIIENSRFEEIGVGPRAHGVYVMNGMSSVKIDRSVFLNALSGGHEIKSRARHTEITDSIIASTHGKGSRLVDVSNGGRLVLRGNVLIEGPNSVNADMFSWGVEGHDHPGHIVIAGNLIISDKPVANLISVGGSPDVVQVHNNLVVGNIFGVDKSKNTIFGDREKAGIKPFPAIPRTDDFEFFREIEDE